MEYIQLAQHSPVAGCYKYANGSSCYKKAGDFLCCWSSPSFFLHGVILDCCHRIVFFFYLKLSFSILKLLMKWCIILPTWMSYRSQDLQRSDRLFLQLKVAFISVQINYRDIFIIRKLFINTFSLEINS